MKRVEIVGGGLAGLALGRALRRHGVPVTIWEAQHYPRHRVCGEFICGLRPDVATTLDLETVLHDALPHRGIVWHRGGKRLRTDTLPAPALGLSRHTLDLRLADAFVAAGGDLRLRARIDFREVQPGRVWATGRRPAAHADWLGLKSHVRGISLEADLEFHLAPGAYVGLTAVERGAANVCGLFRRRPEVRAPAEEILLAYLRACGLGGLAVRLAAGLERGSAAAVAAISFDRRAPADRVALGDAFAMIPPFTGHGMAMAFESAAVALPPLVEYATERVSWAETETAIRQMLQKRFSRRLRLAGILQGFMVRSSGQACFTLLARCGWLPFKTLYRALH